MQWNEFHKNNWQNFHFSQNNRTSKSISQRVNGRPLLSLVFFSYSLLVLFLFLRLFYSFCSIHTNKIICYTVLTNWKSLSLTYTRIASVCVEFVHLSFRSFVSVSRLVSMSTWQCIKAFVLFFLSFCICLVCDARTKPAASDKMGQTMTSSDSKTNLKESTSAMSSGGGGNVALTSVVTGGSSTAIGSQPQSAANHLEIPLNNPNLLSPDILNQRRGMYVCSVLWNMYNRVCLHQRCIDFFFFVVCLCE